MMKKGTILILVLLKLFKCLSINSDAIMVIKSTIPRIQNGKKNLKQITLYFPRFLREGKAL